MFKNDSIENVHEFGNFITKNLVNRVSHYNFSEDFFITGQPSTKEELYSIIERERYISYDSQPEQSYTGDLFKENGKYYLNIRAQCDLTRRNEAGEYNPELYCIVGQVMKTKDIVTEDIRITNEGELIFTSNIRFTLEQIRKTCKNDTALMKLNENFRKQRNKIFFGHGELRENKPEAIIACIDKGKIIRFRMDICIKPFSIIKEKRIGRVLSPYINRIQQKCAQYIVCAGTIPIPEGIFNDMVD